MTAPLGVNGQGLELVLFVFGKDFGRDPAGLSMGTPVGDGVEPLPRGRIDGTEGSELESSQEVLLDVADSVFDPSLLLGLADPTSLDAKPIVPSQVEITRMKQWGFSALPLEHRHLAVIDHDFPGHSAEVFQGVAVAHNKVLLFFGEGKLHIHEPAVTEYHDEEGKPAAGRPHGDGTGAAPIDLGTAGAKWRVKKAAWGFGRTWRIKSVRMV